MHATIKNTNRIHKNKRPQVFFFSSLKYFIIISVCFFCSSLCMFFCRIPGNLRSLALNVLFSCPCSFHHITIPRCIEILFYEVFCGAMLKKECMQFPYISHSWLSFFLCIVVIFFRSVHKEFIICAKRIFEPEPKQQHQTKISSLYIYNSFLVCAECAN